MQFGEIKSTEPSNLNSKIYTVNHRQYCMKPHPYEEIDLRSLWDCLHSKLSYGEANHRLLLLTK